MKLNRPGKKLKGRVRKLKEDAACCNTTMENEEVFIFTFTTESDQYNKYLLTGERIMNF